MSDRKLFFGMSPTPRKILLQCCMTLLCLLCALPCLAAKTETAMFAGGCFWSIQHDFDKLPGVVKTVVGYTGGKVANPTYEQVSKGDTGHYESIVVSYDPDKISYDQLVEFFWRDIDPGDAAGQFCDKGHEYKSVIFYENPEQMKMATASKNKLAASGRFNQIATQIMPAQTFYPAEEYHQKYAEKNPVSYSLYRTGCRRDARTEAIWGK